MSVEDVRRFYSRLAEDKELREKIAKAGEKLKDSIKTKEDLQDTDMAKAFALLEPFAREMGCPFTVEDLRNFEQNPTAELADEDLDAVSGGKGVCVCISGGGGQSDFKWSDGAPCAPRICVIAGVASSPDGFCACPLAGGGSF